MTVNTRKYAVLAGGLIIPLLPGTSIAEFYFDPSMISGDASSVADLTRFETNGTQLPGIYDVDVTVNGVFKGRHDILFTERSKNTTNSKANGSPAHDDSGLTPCLDESIIENLGINTSVLQKNERLQDKNCVEIEILIPQARSIFDFEKMALNFAVPQIYINSNPRGWISPEQWDEGISAALFSWQISGVENNGRYGRSRSQFMNLSSGLNLGPWRLRDKSTWTNSENAYNKQQRWLHLSTVIQRAIIPWRSELTIGDSVTSSDVFDALSFRGIQLATDDSMYPDTMRGFAPVIRGIAEGNAQVSVRQQGNEIYRIAVAPGAFEIRDLYPVTTGGDLDVSIIEENGKVHSFSVPYSAVPVLQRESRLKYALTAGRFQNSSESYDDPIFMQGTLLWGLPHSITLYGGLQLSDNYQATTLGSGMNMGSWGALSVDLTGAESTLADGSKNTGQSLRFLYGRSQVSTGTTFQLAGYRFSTLGFYTLDETALKRMSGWRENNVTVDASGQPVKTDWSNHYSLYNNKRAQLQLNLSQRLGDYGFVFLMGSRQTYWGKTPTTTGSQAGFNSAIGIMNYSLAYGYSQYSGQSKADRSLAFTLSMPFASESKLPAWMTYSMSKNSNGGVTQRAGVSGTMEGKGTLNWGITQGYDHNNKAAGDINLGYLGGYGKISAGYGYSNVYQQVRYATSGSAIVHGNGITFGQALGATNILVDVGAPDIPVENGTAISTDWRGYAVVPYANQYRINRVALDVSELDDNTDIEESVSRVVPTRGAVVRKKFTAKVGIRALLTLHHNGDPLPFGTIVSSADGTITGITGDDGQTYISGLSEQGILKAKWGKRHNQECTIQYQLSAKVTEYPVIRTQFSCY